MECAYALCSSSILNDEKVKHVAIESCMSLQKNKNQGYLSTLEKQKWYSVMAPSEFAQQPGCSCHGMMFHQALS